MAGREAVMVLLTLREVVEESSKLVEDVATEMVDVVQSQLWLDPERIEGLLDSPRALLDQFRQFAEAQ